MKKLLIFFTLTLLAVGFIFILFNLQISSKSRIQGYDLKMDRFRYVQSLFKNNYYDGEGLWKIVNITLTSERQPFMAVTKDIKNTAFPISYHQK